MSVRSLELYVDQRAHWCGTTMSAHSDAGGPTGRNFVGCPVFTECQEAREHGACILFMGQKTWKVQQAKTFHYEGRKRDLETVKEASNDHTEHWNIWKWRLLLTGQVTSSGHWYSGTLLAFCPVRRKTTLEYSYIKSLIMELKMM